MVSLVSRKTIQQKFAMELMNLCCLLKPRYSCGVFFWKPEQTELNALVNIMLWFNYKIVCMNGKTELPLHSKPALSRKNDMLIDNAEKGYLADKKAKKIFEKKGFVLPDGYLAFVEIEKRENAIHQVLAKAKIMAHQKWCSRKAEAERFIAG
jgi:hypothetical protein